MLVLSIISLVVSIAALVLAILWRRSVSTVTTLEDSVKFLTLSVAALEKQVKATIEKPAETEKEPTIPVTYDTKSKTVTLSSNLLVTGFVTATKGMEE